VNELANEFKVLGSDPTSRTPLKFFTLALPMKGESAAHLNRLTEKAKTA